MCDVNEEHNADSDVYKIDPFVDLNTSKQCFLTLKKNKSSFKCLLTGETKKQNLTAERRNQVSKQVFSQTFFLWGGGGGCNQGA